MKRVMNLLDIISLIRLKHFYIGLLILKKFDFNNRTFKKLIFFRIFKFFLY